MKESDVPDHINTAMYFPIRIKAQIHDERGLIAVGEWMSDNVGEQSVDWDMESSESMYVKHVFYFMRNEDKVMFILRWL